MTESTCWIDYRRDRRTKKRNSEGWYGAPSQSNSYKIPGPCPKNGYWPSYLVEWCQSRGVPFRNDELGGDGSLITRAKVTKEQIQDFLAFMFDDVPCYNDPAEMLFWKGRASKVHSLIDVKVFVAQELRPKISYDLVADTW